MLTVKNLSSGYHGTDIIREIYFETQPGQMLAIIGPNGCGKTTLLKTLARLLKYKGKIFLENQEISSLSRKALAQKIAQLSQSYGIFFPYTVYDTVSLGRYPYSSSLFGNLTREDDEIICNVLAALRLLETRDRMINELSGGQLQRVFLARTIVQEPGLILLDEPTNHLDLKHQVELLEYLAVWVKEKKRSVIAVMHDLNLTRRYADTAVLMNDGKMVLSGTCDSVLSDEKLAQVYGLDIKSFMIDSLSKWKA